MSKEERMRLSMEETIPGKRKVGYSPVEMPFSWVSKVLPSV